MDKHLSARIATLQNAVADAMAATLPSERGRLCEELRAIADTLDGGDDEPERPTRGPVFDLAPLPPDRGDFQYSNE